jgi:hypothetical protein
MSIASVALTPVRAAWRLIQKAFGTLDRGLVAAARPFGVDVVNPWKRYGVLLGVYAVIYLVALLPVPWLPLAALAFGYIGILAVGRAWVLNEKVRSAIAKKLRDGNPDDLPDLRGLALVSALQLLILFPLMFMKAQQQFHLYNAPSDATFWTWVLFTLDSYNKAFLGLLEIYDIKFEHVTLGLPAGRHLMTLVRLTFDYILIQGIVRLIAIRETVRDAVAAVKTDRDLAERLGRRALSPLLYALDDDNAEVRARAAEALGSLGYTSAVPELIDALKDRSETVRERAAKALGVLGDGAAVGPLTEATKDADRYVKAAAEEAIKKLSRK